MTAAPRGSKTVAPALTPRIIRASEKRMRYNMLHIFKAVSFGLAASLVLALAMVSGCSREASQQGAEPDFERLEQRVRERWQAKIDRDFDRMWEYATPEYRKIFPKHLYRQSFSYALDWELTSVEVIHYDADAAVASVAVRVMSIPTKQTSEASRLIGATPSELREQWIFIDGEWWHSANI